MRTCTQCPEIATGGSVTTIGTMGHSSSTRSRTSESTCEQQALDATMSCGRHHRSRSHYLGRADEIGRALRPMRAEAPPRHGKFDEAHMARAAGRHKAQDMHEPVQEGFAPIARGPPQLSRVLSRRKAMPTARMVSSHACHMGPPDGTYGIQ